MTQMKQTCILILGMHRSGTSALTGTLAKLGIYIGDDLMASNEYNPKGYFENNILYEINEKLLAECSSNWDDVFYKPNKLELLLDSPILQELKTAIVDQFASSELFAIKDPRLAYLFPLYEQILESLEIDIRIIIPYRNPIEVAQSLKKRDGMSIERSMLLWAYHLFLSEKTSRNYKRCFLAFDELMSNHNEVILKIDKALQLDLHSIYKAREPEINSFLESGLKHHNSNMDDLAEETPKVIKELLTLRKEFGTEQCSKKLDILYSDFLKNHQLFFHKEITALAQELNNSRHILSSTKQELQNTQEALYVKEQEFDQNQKALHIAQQKFQESKEALHVTKQGLQESQEALHITRQELQESQEALHVTKQELQESQEALHVTKQELQESQEALHVTKQEFQKSINDLRAKERIIINSNTEIDLLKDEICSIYNSRSWKTTTLLRRIKRIFS